MSSSPSGPVIGRPTATSDRSAIDGSETVTVVDGPGGNGDAGRSDGLILRLWTAGRGLIRQLAKFGVVGVIALVVDVGLFNLVSYVGADPLLDGQPLLAKIVSTAAATLVAWLGNRYWTFRHTRRSDMRREAVLYFVMCTIGLFIALSCLWISHYALGFTSPLADNIAANVVGLALGTTFRFWAYKRFVFTGVAAPAPAAG